jgi:GTPase SAR1 family protein
MVASGTSHEDDRVLRLCTLLWAEEHAEKRPLTYIPDEVVKLGVASTEAFIASRSIEFCLKIFLVGSNHTGKSSFIRSITPEQPQNRRDDDRTIDIDRFSLRFQQISNVTNTVKIYDVTFWDFVGKDTYQVSSSLFFSPRTLFMVFVDLQAFAIAYMQAAIFANEGFQEPTLLGEFVDDAIGRWVFMILTHQPAAEFVFIVTKEDLLAENRVTERLLKESLRTKLTEVETTTRDMRNQSSVEERLTSPVLFTSCTTPATVDATRLKIEKMIMKSSLLMPETYPAALQSIIRTRETARTHDIITRINEVFVTEDSLSAQLNIDRGACQDLLRTMHDLGDVLWYEGLGIAYFRNSVVLDPLLLVDFIREVFTHRQADVTLAHADLMSLPYWIGLTDQTKMEAVKQVLQKFKVVYATREDGVMEWDSALIVAAYWQIKKPASWLFLGDILRLNSTRTRDGRSMTIDWENDFVHFNTMRPRMGEDKRVHWEFCFVSGLPQALFDDLIAASVSPYVKFDAGPDWIVYEERGVAACRIMVDRDLKSLHRTIRIEAVVAESAVKRQADKMWRVFEKLSEALVRVLRENHRSKVSSFAWNDNGNKVGFKDLVRKGVSEEAWMPPAATWKLVKDQLAQYYEGLVGSHCGCVGVLREL